MSDEAPVPPRHGRPDHDPPLACRANALKASHTPVPARVADRPAATGDDEEPGLPAVALHLAATVGIAFAGGATLFWLFGWIDGLNHAVWVACGCLIAFLATAFGRTRRGRAVSEWWQDMGRARAEPLSDEEREALHVPYVERDPKSLRHF
ncbi:hypothetical protein [Conexibacter sp. SYSU D00693]|uniref:hypothetical protein n=1 Tax=Conexibacter sp. SYSU D00693 TaxID=2812560 RepID=UPI00196B2275|nr:hypothetical protein [Conexibacter sp. SYSU D00693]